MNLHIIYSIKNISTIKDFQKGLIDLIFKQAKNKEEIDICKYVKIKDIGKYINNFGFVNCNYLNCITFVNSVKFIGSGAFWNCQNLELINIPNSVIDIGKGAFGNCKSLNLIIIPKRFEPKINDIFKAIDLSKI